MLLLTLFSELALLLVARGESAVLAVLLRAGPVLTLYMEDAGTLAINGRRLPGILRRMSYPIIPDFRPKFIEKSVILTVIFAGGRSTHHVSHRHVKRFLRHRSSKARALRR